MQKIMLTNTLTRKKEEFKPIKENQVHMYTCGPTVYHFAHIGNLRTYLTADILRRMFLFNNFNVTAVMNITDVGHLSSDADEGEDKMEKGAKREGKTVQEIAQFYTDAFLQDLKALGIKLPDIMPKATNHIKEMIQIIQKLEQKGFTYKAGGNIYFDVTKFKTYGKLANIDVSKELNQEHSRVGLDENKKNSRDFVLWFTESKYENHAQTWESPWGIGYPGWHIECSAMSSKYLGEQFDIHLGGIDLIPTHHTNEIAQSECAFGHTWVNYWVHSEHLNMGELKMSKSSGEFLTLPVLQEKGYDPIAYRYFLLGTHYKKTIAFSWESLDGATNSLKKLKHRVIELKESENLSCQGKRYDTYIEKFCAAINDDINTPKALAVLWEMLNDGDLGEGTKYKLACKLDEVLGLGIEQMQEEVIPQEIQKLAKQRQEARNNKDWNKSDELRDKIKARGFEVRDTKEGPKIKKI